MLATRSPPLLLCATVLVACGFPTYSGFDRPSGATGPSASASAEAGPPSGDIVDAQTEAAQGANVDVPADGPLVHVQGDPSDASTTTSSPDASDTPAMVLSDAIAAGASDAAPPPCSVTPPSGCHCLAYGGAAYTFCFSPQNWANSTAACAESQMHLVDIRSRAENDFILTQIVGAAASSGAFASVWWGGGSRDSFSEWHWSNGDPFWKPTPMMGGSPVAGAFTNWTTGEPNITPNDCLALRGARVMQGWGTAPCADLHPYVCKSP